MANGHGRQRGDRSVAKAEESTDARRSDNRVSRPDGQGNDRSRIRQAPVPLPVLNRKRERLLRPQGAGPTHQRISRVSCADRTS